MISFKGNRGSSKGFTLIEMVVVLVILSVVTLLVWPRLPDTRGAALKNSAKALTATIYYLGDHVITTRIPHRLRLFPGSGDVTVSVLPPGGTESAPTDPFLKRRILAEGVIIADVQLPQLGTATTGEVLLDFGPAGLAEPVTIHLREAGGKEMTIIAFSNGRRVKVEDGRQEAKL